MATFQWSPQQTRAKKDPAKEYRDSGKAKPGPYDKFVPGLKDEGKKQKDSEADKVAEQIANTDPNDPQAVVDAIFSVFGKSGGVFTPAFGPDFENTATKLVSALQQNSRANVPPRPVQVWECRIGLTKLMVPPININVTNQFRTGSLAQGVLRQNTPPKFNSGHSETRISMTLYFPTHESIWGFDGDRLEIDFNNADDDVIDTYLSSLRGLITQFKYAPFLPIRNTYLNQVYNITAVVMESMSVSTVQGFPFCVAVQLNMLHFNHEVFLPMIDDFNSAFHWGRFRQYLGKAAIRIDQAASKNFLTRETAERTELDKPGTADQIVSQVRNISELAQPEALAPVHTFNKRTDWLNGQNFDLFYIDRDPSRVFAPDLTDFRSNRDPESIEVESSPKRWWQDLLSLVGFNVNTTPSATWDNADRNAQLATRQRQDLLDHTIQREFMLLTEWLQRTNLIVNAMGPGQLDEYIAERLKDYGPNIDEGARAEIENSITQTWFAAMYLMYLNDPYIQNVLSFQNRRRGTVLINEWEIPMRNLGLNKDRVIVNGVSVSMGNNIASLQVQMQDKPVYQHLGGLETRCEISLTIFGEEDIIALRRMFETISGLSRLEHGHAVLGFLGIKNVLTTLCGMKYALPIAWDIKTIPGYPHVYSVTISLTDFDVFQQKREVLSSEQQADLIEAFSKRNPFLRIKQHWAAFNAYPDMPLDVRDETNKIIGHFDPDYYFRAFQAIDDDIVDWRASAVKFREENQGVEDIYSIDYNFGVMSDSSEEASKIRLHTLGMDFVDGDTTKFSDMNWYEPSLANTRVAPFTPGLTPPSEHQNPYESNAPNLNSQFDKMMKDMQYRDKGGRMIRAFPTYMLWLIDEGGLFAGVKLFDNFYGLQSVVDMSLVSSEDLLGDTLTLRLSNLYSRLSTKFRDLIDDDVYASARIINTQLNRTRNLTSGLTDYLVRLDTIDLKPGVRVHLRMGYSANPNALDTVFNGTITHVEQGDIVTIVAQSDAIELGAIVNGSDKDGNSGNIDGSLMSGLWMSEPRDLMCRMLSMGSNTMREALAHASRGMVFSENRYGIRHFGAILYDPMSDEEERRQNARADNIQKQFSQGARLTPKDVVGSVVGFMNSGLIDLGVYAWNNFNRKRDYELYKRNIYPGNGLGISQYLGGDFGDGGFNTGFSPTGVNPDGQLVDPVTGAPMPINGQDPRVILQEAARIVRKKHPNKDFEVPEEDGDDGPSWFGIDLPDVGPLNPVLDLADDATKLGIKSAFDAFIPGGSAVRKTAETVLNFSSPFLQMMGITQMQGYEDDIAGFDEISFRAQTYMKTVWDIFQVCAGLLPNYIVAVRPFEDRSTVFYGKPHWLYTSGVIPLSTGIDPNISPKLIEKDADELTKILEAVDNKFKEKETPTEFYHRLIGLAKGGDDGGDPFATPEGITWRGENINELSLVHPNLGIELPQRVTTGFRGFHLPTSKSIDVDKDQHKSLDGILPPQWRHPYYMDRDSGTDDKKSYASYFSKNSGNDERTVEYDPTPDKPSVLNEDNDLPGRLPDSGQPVTPINELYYISMYWDYAKGGKGNYFNGQARVMLYNKRTRKGVICAIADRNPNTITNAIVMSPEVWVLLQSADLDEFQVGFVADDYPLGPVIHDTSGQINVGEALTGNKVPTDSLGNPTLPHWMTTKQDGSLRQDRLNNESGTNVALYSFKYGSTQVNVPIDYTDPQSGLVDPVGQAAAEVYSKGGKYGDGSIGWDGRSLEQAQKIWKELRQHYQQMDDKYFIEIFNRAYPELAIATDYKRGGTKDKEKKFEQVLKDFYDFLWQNPYHRGWVVKTADVKYEGLWGDVDGIPILNWAGKSGVNFVQDTIVDSVTGIPGKIVGSVGFVKDVGGFLGIGGGGGKNESDSRNTPSYEWDFDRVHRLWAVYITQGKDFAVQWMLANNGPGKEQDGLIGRSVEEAWTKIFQPIYNFLKSVTQGFVTAISSIISLVRISLLTLTQGMGMASYMSRQANLLNKAFNDSIYFNKDYGVGSLMYLADNPFTREYGEPVVEIRQPFQRIHHLNSFQHILNNGIQQNVENVATVITATSRGKNPVTVWFDKGAPVEAQLEKNVETGLWFDAPKGILGNLLHPIAATRNMFNVLNAQPDELLAKRVALWHLKKNLQDIYGGEIIVLGDPSIRPHDLVYIGDTYERIYGMFEVEKVIHHFMPGTGFITTITPNAVVTINDPMRWSMIAMAKNQLSGWIVRNQLRHALGVRTNKAIYGLSPTTDANALADTLEAEIMGHIDYTGGASALIKDATDASLKGMLLGAAVGGTAGVLAGGIPGLTFLAPFGGLLGGGAIWNASKWVTENLLDQHGCYIQYLNKNGSAMDAGLSYNSGVAVGRNHVATLFARSLRLPISITRDGHSRITTNDLLSKLGWREWEIEEVVKDVDLWNNQINAEVLKLSGRSPDGLPFQRIDAKIVTVTEAIDGATFAVEETDFAANGVRLAGIVAPAIPANAALEPNNIGTAAKEYLQRRLIDDPIDQGYRPTVALRVDPNKPRDKFGRVQAWVFHNVPSTVELGDSDTRDAVLKQQAERWPQIEWDSFLAEGKPYTFNWESVVAGFTNIDKTLFSRILPPIRNDYGG